MIKKYSRYIACLAAVCLVLTGCAGSKAGGYRPFDDNGHVHVVASIFAAYDFARQVGGSNADVKLLLKPGSEAHSFEPTPRDIIAIEKCDVFVCTGGENDAWVDTILDAIDNPDLKIIRMTECVDGLLEEEEVDGMHAEGGMLAGILGTGHHHHEHEEHEEHEEHDVHDGHEGHDEAEWDEHVWMDADNAILICNELSRVFAETDGAHAADFAKNCEEYTAILREADSDIKKIVESADRREVVFADRFPARYFTERYGLEYSAAFPGCSESTEADAATVSHLINKVRDDGIHVVFKMELSSGKLAAAVAEETGAKVGTFYTGHNVTAQDFEAGITFADMMRENAKLLQSALAEN